MGVMWELRGGIAGSGLLGVSVLVACSGVRGRLNGGMYVARNEAVEGNGEAEMRWEKSSLSDSFRSNLEILILPSNEARGSSTPYSRVSG